MELFKIENCRAFTGCPRAVADTSDITKLMEEILEQENFTKIRGNQLGKQVKYHNIFKICLAGCANGCSQPQIKDFALIPKVFPRFSEELCTMCGICCTVCRENSLQIDKQLVFNRDKCLGCGDCWRACPTQAIQGGEVKWRLLVGGKLGRHPQLAKEIAEVSTDQALDYLRKSFDIILKSNEPHKRFADLLKDQPLK